MSLRIPHFWRRFFGYLVLSLLVLVTLGLTAVRLLLPYAEGYHAQAEQQASAYLKQPVRIGALSAGLRVLTPTLLLRDVQLLDAEGRKVVAQFSEIQVGLAPVASLRQGKPVVAQVTVVGASLAVERRADGSFHVQGLVDDQEGDPEAVGRWLLAQDRVALRNSHLVWKDARSGRSFDFDGAAVELANSGARHRLDGHVTLPGDLGGQLRVAADMTGDPFAAGGLQGEVYLAAERMRPAGLLRLQPVEGVHATGGHLSLEVWGTWDRVRLTSAEARLLGEGLEFEGENGRREILSQVAGRIGWQRTADGWRLDASDLVLARAGRTWEPARLRVDLVGGGSAAQRAYSLHASFLRVEDLAAIAALVPAGGEWQKQLVTFGPRGDLRQVRADFAPDGAVSASAAFTDLGVQATARYPGVGGLDGELAYDNGVAELRFQTRDAQINLHQLFRAPLILKQMRGALTVARDGAAWRVSSDGLALANDDIRLRAALALRVPDKGKPFLDLRGDFRNGRAVTVPRYLPAHIMPANAVAWLDRAFKAGTVVQGGVLVHGELDKFPFDHGEGRFEVRFEARDVDLDYMPDWPLLTGIHGEVVFDGRSMRIAAQRARLAGTQLTATTVAIPDLLHSRLVVSGHADGQLNQLFDYLRQTRLAGYFSDPLGRFSAGGHYTLDLNFEQPLGDDSEPGVVRGSASFDGSRLAVARGVEFTDIRGQVRFDNGHYESERISARLFGEPARIQVGAAGNDATRIALEGTLDAASVGRAFAHPLVARLRGRTRWDGQVLLAHDEGAESSLRVRSRMIGMAVQLPAPVGKPAEERRDLSVQMRFTGPRAGELELGFGDRLAATLALPEQGPMERAAVHFGAAVPPLPQQPGYVITGRLPEFAPRAWLAVLSAAAANKQGSAKASGPLPVRVDLDELGIVAEDGAPTKDAATAYDDALPPLDLRVGELRYHQLQLGALSLRVQPSARWVEIKELDLTAPGFKVAGSGHWLRDRKPRTEFELRSTGKDLGAAADALGFASVISRGNFDLQAKLAWEGAPQDFSAATLAGSLQMKIKDGSLTEIKPGAGRLIGLLSLQALPQRLILDFRDLFDEGVRFRTIEGTVNFKDGDAFSDNLHMNALPAAVFVSGRTGLVRRDFDQTVTVVPDVSSTLPVAGGLALGPQVGAALLLVQQLFHKKIDEAAKFAYTVTGSWDQPVVTRIGKKR